MFNTTLYADDKFTRGNVEMLHWSENGQLRGSVRLKQKPDTPAIIEFIHVLYSKEHGCWGLVNDAGWKLQMPSLTRTEGKGMPDKSGWYHVEAVLRPNTQLRMIYNICSES